jgi:murein DD-endopeptidase MepM/ murein hydrolase activator NlpD
VNIDPTRAMAADALQHAQAEGLQRGQKGPEEAARSFEAFMVQWLVKEMRETLPESGLFSTPAAQTFSGLFDQEIADRVSRTQTFGLAEQILRSLQGRSGGSGEAYSSGGLEALEPRSARRWKGEGVPLPVVGRISSGFGLRKDPLDGDLRRHKGLDIAAAKGSPIHPVRPGRVVLAGEQDGYGRAVVVDHGDGMQTLYAHCSELKVRQGDMVDPNTIIATVGSTGRSTGPHLHFEVREGGRQVDPLEAFGWER